MRKMGSQNNKMSLQQKIVLVEWLGNPDNNCIINTTTSRKHPPEMIMEKWGEVSEILNHFPGTNKTADRWKKAFGELRSHIKKKQRTYIAQKKAGNKFAAPLSEVNQRYIKLFELANNDENENGLPITEEVCVPQAEVEINWPDSDNDSIDLSIRNQKEEPSSKDVARPTEQCNHPESETEFITKAWAIKLNRMNSEQRLLTEKFVNEVLLEGILCNLHRNALDFNMLNTGRL